VSTRAISSRTAFSAAVGSDEKPFDNIARSRAILVGRGFAGQVRALLRRVAPIRVVRMRTCDDAAAPRVARRSPTWQSAAMARTLLPMVALCAVLAGCGEPDATPADQRAAAQAAEGFYEALAKADGAGACRALAPDVADAKTCGAQLVKPFSELPREIRHDLTRISAKPVGADGGKVTVEVRTSGRFSEERTQRLDMRRVDGTWRIDGRPQPIDPDRVTQCIANGIDTFEAGKSDAIWRLVGRAQYVYYVQHLCKRVVAEDASGDEVTAIGRSIFRRMERDGRLDQG
jgi:hypothetical protein